MYAELDLLRNDFANNLSIFDDRLFPIETRQNRLEKRVIDLEYENEDLKRKVADADLKGLIGIVIGLVALIF